jgi:hypothetical protein
MNLVSENRIYLTRLEKDRTIWQSFTRLSTLAGRKKCR